MKTPQQTNMMYRPKKPRYPPQPWGVERVTVTDNLAPHRLTLSGADNEQHLRRQAIYDALFNHCRDANTELTSIVADGLSFDKLEQWQDRYHFRFAESGTLLYDAWTSMRYASATNCAFRLYTGGTISGLEFQKLVGHTRPTQSPARAPQHVVGTAVIGPFAWSMHPGQATRSEVRNAILDEFSQLLDASLSEIYEEVITLRRHSRDTSLMRRNAEWLVLRAVLELTPEDVKNFADGLPITLEDGTVLQPCASSEDESDENDVDTLRETIKKAISRFADEAGFVYEAQQGRPRVRPISDPIYTDYLK